MPSMCLRGSKRHADGRSMHARSNATCNAGGAVGDGRKIAHVPCESKRRCASKGLIISRKSAAIVQVPLLRETRWSLWMRVCFLTIMADRLPGVQTMMWWSGCVGKDAVGVSCLPCRETRCVRGHGLLVTRSTAKAMIRPRVTGTFFNMGSQRHDEAMDHRAV